MAALSSEDRQRQRRTKSEQAINFAMKSRWDDAVLVNRELLELFPNEVDALNRLGKALTELGRYAEARDAYSRAVKLDPTNSIAAKNIQRLSKLIEEGGTVPRPGSVDPRLFIEESGKTTVTELTDVKRGDAVSKLAAGDAMQIAPRGNQIWIEDPTGQQIGRLEPKLEQDLLKLLKLGNQYSAVVTAVHEQSVHVILRETHRSPAMGTRVSFRPTAAAETGFRSYTRESMLRLGADDEDDEDDDSAEDDEEEAEVEPAAADADAVEETSLDAMATEEEPEEPS